MEQRGVKQRGVKQPCETTPSKMSPVQIEFQPLIKGKKNRVSTLCFNPLFQPLFHPVNRRRCFTRCYRQIEFQPFVSGENVPANFHNAFLLVQRGVKQPCGRAMVRVKQRLPDTGDP